MHHCSFVGNGKSRSLGLLPAPFLLFSFVSSSHLPAIKRFPGVQQNRWDGRIADATGENKWENMDFICKSALAPFQLLIAFYKNHYVCMSFLCNMLWGIHPSILLSPSPFFSCLTQTQLRSSRVNVRWFKCKENYEESEYCKFIYSKAGAVYRFCEDVTLWSVNLQKGNHKLLAEDGNLFLRHRKNNNTFQAHRINLLLLVDGFSMPLYSFFLIVIFEVLVSGW